MKLALTSEDRLHMIVFKGSWGDWCAARGLNGLCVDYAEHFATWREAMDYALWRCEP